MITDEKISKVQELTDKAKALHDERMWRLKLSKEFQDLNISEADIDGYDIRDAPQQAMWRVGPKGNRQVMVGCWLKKPRYKDKQKGHPSNYRRFSRPIPVRKQ